MHLSSVLTRPTPTGTTLLRLATLIFCVGAAPLASLMAQEAAGTTATAAAYPTPPAVPEPDKILASIPVAKGDSATDQALTSTLGNVRKTPQDAVAWVNLADALAQICRDTDDLKYNSLAEQSYGRALQLNPRSVDAMDGMAGVAASRGAYDQSVSWAKRALALDEDNAAACGLIGDAALERGDYDAALENYQKMMDLKPDLSSWSRGASLLWITGNRSKAIWLMERAVKAGAPYAENTAWCRAAYAMMLFNDGALLPATQALAPALAAGTRNPQVLLAAGTIASAQLDFDAAAKDYHQVLDAGPNLEALVALGDLSTAKGEKDEAEKYYAQVESLAKSNPALGVHDPLFLAKFEADHDRNLDDALRLAETHTPTKNVLEADTLAWVYFKASDLPHAVAEMKLALSRNTADAEMQFHAGMIAAAADDRPSAQKHLQAALSYNPHFNVLEAPTAVATLRKLGSGETGADNGAKAP